MMCMVIYISFYVGCDTINPLPAEHDFVVFKLFNQSIKLLILGMKWVFEHQDL